MSFRPHRTALFLSLAITVCAVGCDRTKPEATSRTPVRPDPESAKTTSLPDGHQLIARFECHRCHRIEGIDEPPVNMNCTGCHRAIITRTYPEPEEYLAMWDDGLENMRDVPSLVDADERFRRDWFVEFLLEPHDLRPRLGASMPRLDLSRPEAEAIADYLELEETPAPVPEGDAGRGRALFDRRGCGSCHVITGVAVEASPIPVDMKPDRLSRAMLLAPDLRETRARYRPEALTRWLQNPTDVKEDALMPDLGLTEQEATDIAAFLLRHPLEDAATASPPAVKRPAPLKREVRWEEVQAKLIDEICLHCHSDPGYNDGDGGPGSTGGFGYPGKGLDFSTYGRAVYGADGGDEPRPIYEPLEDGTPQVIAHMLARHDEVAGRNSERLGMPLGFPPIEMKRIRLMDSWIRQGMPE